MCSLKFEQNNFDDIENSNMASTPQEKFLTSCANKKDQDQHMQPLGLVSIIDIACGITHILAKFLISRLFNERIGLGHALPLTPDNIS